MDKPVYEGQEGRFANYFEIGCSETHVVIDFGQAFGEDPPVQHTRIVISFRGAAQLREMLDTTLANAPRQDDVNTD